MPHDTNLCLFQPMSSRYHHMHRPEANKAGRLEKEERTVTEREAKQTQPNGTPRTSTTPKRKEAILLHLGVEDMSLTTGTRGVPCHSRSDLHPR